jgi:uncharacterized RDD family membrane protein YckC
MIRAVPSWSKTEALSETVATTTASRLRSGTPPPLHTPDPMERTAYTADKPKIDPARQPENDPLLNTCIDHFEIRGLAGEGGMGRVYIAHDMSLDRPVALKLLRQEYAGQEELTNRLIHEARAQARIQHPHVVSVYYIGEFQGAPYFAMEWVDGITLGQYLEQHGPLPWKEALEIVIQTARALMHAHLKRFSHRDIKPSNIILSKGRQYRSNAMEIKVTDFGLAAPIGQSEQHFMGTPRYASPELIEGRVPDHRSDIYALGIMFWELLMGKVPFDADSLPELFRQHQVGIRPPLPAQKAPWRLRQLIMEMMDADALKRPHTYEELLDRLTHCRPTVVNPGGVAARGFAWAVDLALVVGGSSVAFEKMYLTDSTKTWALLVMYFLYYVLSHWLWGATIGKRAMNLRLQGAHHALSLPRILIRFVVQLWGPLVAAAMVAFQVGDVSDMSAVTEAVGGDLPVMKEALSPVLSQLIVPNIIVGIGWIAGFAIAFGSDDRKALHDRLASTRVVYSMNDPSAKAPTNTGSLGANRS